VDSGFILARDSWGEGVYPPVVMERARNDTKRKGIEAFPLERNGAQSKMAEPRWTEPKVPIQKFG